MSESANFQFFDVEGEVKHELTHIIRYENGRSNKIKKNEKYLPTEEGLATLMQDQSKNGTGSQFQHAAEYLASDIGTNGSLKDVFYFFTTLGFSNELAWQRASRHKFGFKNTSSIGDIIKPAMYYYHSRLIENLAKSDILKLFSGKIALSDLSHVEKYQGIIPEQKIKDYFEIFSK